jgi:hypothetical protein
VERKWATVESEPDLPIALPIWRFKIVSAVLFAGILVGWVALDLKPISKKPLGLRLKLCWPLERAALDWSK